MSPQRPYLYLRLLYYLSAKVTFLQVSTIQAVGRRALSSNFPYLLDNLAYTIYTYLKHPQQSLNYLIRHYNRLPCLCRNYYRNYNRCRDLLFNQSATADDLLYNQSALQQTTSSTTSLPHSRRPPLQPVCPTADDLLYNQSAAERTTSYNQSTAVVLQTTSTATGPRLSRYRQSNYRGPQAYRRRTAGVPQTMHCQGSCRGQGKGAGPCYHQHVKYKVYGGIGIYTLYKTTL